jgi:hypothetical protein
MGWLDRGSSPHCPAKLQLLFGAILDAFKQATHTATLAEITSVA